MKKFCKFSLFPLYSTIPPLFSIPPLIKKKIESPLLVNFEKVHSPPFKKGEGGFKLCTSFHNFHQLVSEPTHLLPQSNSCIDLIFTDQPTLVVNCGTHASLSSKCHHQIIHCKLNLNIEYPAPYEQLVWDYIKANIESIQKSIKSVNWETLFYNKTVNKKVFIFNETITNIFSNFVPNKLVTFDDSNPPWMNDFIKNKIKCKHQIYKTYIKKWL